MRSKLYSTGVVVVFVSVLSACSGTSTTEHLTSRQGAIGAELASVPGEILVKLRSNYNSPAEMARIESDVDAESHESLAEVAGAKSTS